MTRANDRAIDVALELAEQRFGVGRGTSAPGWARDRVRTVLEGQAVRHGADLAAVAARLASDHGAIEELVSALRVGETRFYRDRAQWKACLHEVLPALPASAEISALSAGCSTGEEAYTLAMLLTVARRRFRVLGVDRSQTAIAAARAGIYAADSARDLPAPWASRFCEKVGEGLRVRPALAEQVAFETCDLVERTPRGPFHIVFFKNVLLYLAAPAGEAVATRLVRELAPGGLLFAASSEVLRLRQAGLASVRIGGSITAFRARG